jgi:hypothetical protein
MRVYMRAYLIALSLLPIATVVRAQGILLEGVLVTLGEPRADVVERLEERFSLERLTPDGDSWVVVSPRPGLPFYGIGSVTFSGGVLSFVSRQWGPEDASDGLGLAQSVVGALSQLRGADGGCSATPSRAQQPNSITELVVIACGRHSVTISTGTVGNDRSITVSESWRLN